MTESFAVAGAEDSGRGDSESISGSSWNLESSAGGAEEGEEVSPVMRSRMRATEEEGG